MAKPGWKRKGHYGLDAPYLLPIPALYFLLCLVGAVVWRKPGPLIGDALILPCIFFGLHTSLRGKFVVWSGLLDGLGLSGDERILDIGCGRGAVLLMAAEHLDTGKAVGIDIWKRGDQSGNGMESTLSNARAEGVLDRVEVQTADMTRLPFAGPSFDVIVSNVAIHNVKGTPARLQAIDEAVRVLKPGGRILIADLMGSQAYSARLEALGLTGVTRQSVGWRGWWGGPWAATYLVQGTKPSAA